MKHKLKLVRRKPRTIWTYQLECTYCHRRFVYVKWGIRDIVTNRGIWRPELFENRPLGVCLCPPIGRVEKVVQDTAGLSAQIVIDEAYAKQLGMWASGRE